MKKCQMDTSKSFVMPVVEIVVERLASGEA
jgi:hypothetical protein